VEGANLPHAYHQTIFRPFSTFFVLFQRFSSFFNVFRPFSTFFVLFQRFSSFFVLFQRFSTFFNVFRPFSKFFVLFRRFPSFFDVFRPFSTFFVLLTFRHLLICRTSVSVIFRPYFRPSDFPTPLDLSDVRELVLRGRSLPVSRHSFAWRALISPTHII
jgi:hypothetical protein